MVFEPIETHSNSAHDSSEVKHFTVWAEDRLLNHHRKWPGDGGSTALRRAATKLGGVETFANKTMAKAARAAKARLFQVLDSHVQTIQETAQVSPFCRFSILCFFLSNTWSGCWLVYAINGLVADVGWAECWLPTESRLGRRLEARGRGFQAGLCRLVMDTSCFVVVFYFYFLKKVA